MTKPIKRLKKNGLILILVVFATPFFQPECNAQDKVKTLTLEEAIEIAKEQSPDALMATHRFRRSYWQFRSYKASYLPSLVFDGNLPAYNQGIISYYNEESGTTFDYYDQNMIQGNLSLNQQIGWTGGNISINSNLQRLDNLIDDSRQYSSNLIDITYYQPLFNYNSYKWDRLIQPIEYEEAKKRYLEEMENVAVTATNHFFSLLLTQIRQGIAIVNHANYDTLYKIAEGRYNLGNIAENELLQLELQLLKARTDVKDAELDVKNQIFKLKSYLRIQDDVDINLVSPDLIEPFLVESTKAIAEARANSSEALSFDRRLIEAESQLARAKYQGRFDADLTASYGYTNTRDNLEELTQDPSNSRVLMLGVKVPIFDWGVAKGQIKMAESNQELERTAVEQAQIDFDQEIFLRVARFNMQFDQVEIAAKADTVAQKGYNVTKARYLIGKISITDLNIAQTSSDNFKIGYITSLWTYWQNYYDLRRLTLYDFKTNKPIEVNYRQLL